MTESERVLGGRYRLDSLLGRGAQGTVWRARDLRLDRDVAVKVTPTSRDLESSGEAREHLRRFHKEALAMARIDKQPHVAEIYDHGADADLLFSVMEYIEGVSLAAHLRRHQPQLEQTVRWTKDICSGLSGAHAAGVIHRDVKPSNIVIDKKDRGAHLVDFGLARLLGGSSSRTPVGSLPYVAPEQLAGRSTASSDLYSLGCVMYEMLTGRTPFGHLTEGAAFWYHHTDRMPDPPRALRPGIPGPLDHLVMRLLKKDPDDRPADARAVARAVEQVEFASDDAAGPHVDSRHVEEIRRLERFIEQHAQEPWARDPEVLDARSRHARLTGESGDSRGAAALYQRLGKDCARWLGPGDKRGFQAYREAARWTERAH
ncbi:serine/threonine protein kinase [Streptomyces sp. NBC_00249]|uniref:serine/threonine-protein kinase n=1 Tax=Streptomyces sp. NBC_00249 TaxID=2975690 RepID=UPI002255857B|nr:serine/threonine-protein kinase [Streptomyces sp. NBC_00249]MCX5193336.1 serine/threonine protein kinase [Streptomyces sp. NBC_00249]